MIFEDCIIVGGYNKHSSSYEWFINQEHIPFDMSSDAHGMYWTMYHEFLKELEQQYLKKGYEYWWFTKSGQLVSDEGREMISDNSVRIDKSKIREYKIDQLLNI